MGRVHRVSSGRRAKRSLHNNLEAERRKDVRASILDKTQPTEQRAVEPQRRISQSPIPGLNLNRETTSQYVYDRRSRSKKMDTAPPNVLQTSRGDSDVNRKITSQYNYGGTRRSKKTNTTQVSDAAWTWRPRDRLVIDDERAPWNWYKPSSLTLLRAARVVLKRQTISFMDLPAEVRNHIYECAAMPDELLRINEDKPTKLSTTSPFSMLSQQTRREYISMLDIQARHIHAEVKDFDFSHIFKFYEHLFRTNPRPEGTRLNEVYYDRALIIHLTFSANYRGKPSDLLLSEWMDQSERVSNIAFEEYDIILQ